MMIVQVPTLYWGSEGQMSVTCSMSQQPGRAAVSSTCDCTAAHHTAADFKGKEKNQIDVL